MERLKTLNELKSITMKQKNINDLFDLTEMNNVWQTEVQITVQGKSITVKVEGLKHLLESELNRTKIKYDDLLKSLIDEEGGF